MALSMLKFVSIAIPLLTQVPLIQTKDTGTSDLLVSNILRMHQLQLWFITQHLVNTPFRWLAKGDPDEQGSYEPSQP